MFKIALFLIVIVLLWIYGIRILAWLLKKILKRQTRRIYQHTAAESDNKKSESETVVPKEKLDFSQITRRKFEKDQGEYVDFYEEKTNE